MIRNMFKRFFGAKAFAFAVLLILLSHLLNFSGITMLGILSNDQDVFFYYDVSVGWGSFVCVMVLAFGFTGGLCSFRIGRLRHSDIIF